MEGANIAKHANGCDYWIIGKPVGNNNINAYLITSTGVNMTPVVSSTGPNLYIGWGSIKVSPDNSVIAIATANNYNGGGNYTNVYDFDNSTGIASHKFSDGAGGYSLEFSPNSTVLYSVRLSNSNIYQYDLTLPNASISGSRTVIGTTSNTIGYKMCGLQLAPDGKIYAALQDANRLGAIENPNVLGVGCIYNDNAIAITGLNTNGSSMNVRLGLPAFPSFFIVPNDIVFESSNYDISQNFCSSDSITFKIQDNGGVQSLDWYVSPVNSVFSTTPSSSTFEYKIPPPLNGSYKVLAVVSYSCYVDSIYDTIVVNNVPVVNLGLDIDTCLNGTVILNPLANLGNNFLWNDGSSGVTLGAIVTGQYSVMVTDGLGCSNADTVEVTINEVPVANFTSIANCKNEIANFNNQSTITSGSIISYNWSFDDGGNSQLNSPSHSYLSDGSYNVQLIVTSDNNCKDTIEVSHVVLPIPIANAGLDSVLNCLRQTMDLDGGNSSSGISFEYLWTTIDGNFTSGTNSTTTSIDDDGMYYLEITDNNNNCSVLDSVFISIDTVLPVIDAGLDTVVNCSHPSIILNGVNSQSGNFTYSWITNNGSIVSGSNMLNSTVNLDGLYYLNVVNNVNHCSSLDSLLVQIDTVYPVSIVSNDTLINCLNPEIQLSGVGSSLGNYDYLWTTINGSILSGAMCLTPFIDAEGIYRLTVTNLLNGCTSSNQVSVIQDGDAFVEIIHNGNSDSIILYFTFNDFSLNYNGNIGTVDWFVDGNSVGSDASLEYIFEESGIHFVTLVLTNSENGCLAYDTLTVNTTHELEIPNGLSPNADGLNDLFVIRALENYEDNSLLIFNRWGSPVFESKPYENNWGGQTNVSNVLSGENVVDGTYFYVLKLVDGGEEFVYKGFIDLIRK